MRLYLSADADAWYSVWEVLVSIWPPFKLVACYLSHCCCEFTPDLYRRILFQSAIHVTFLYNLSFCTRQDLILFFLTFIQVQCVSTNTHWRIRDIFIPSIIETVIIPSRTIIIIVQLPLLCNQFKIIAHRNCLVQLHIHVIKAFVLWCVIVTFK